MQEFLTTLTAARLFRSMAPADIEALLACVSAHERSYSRGEFLLCAGEECPCLGLVLRGGVHVVREDFWGRRDIIAELRPGDAFAESFACTGAPLSVDVLASEDCAALYLDAGRALSGCPSACAFHTQLIRNLTGVIAESNLRLNEKIAHVTRRSTREKLLSYLSAQARRAGSSRFELPLNRQQLADYLAVDRSAMSAELGRMRDEGLIRFARSHFELLKPPRA